jgi:hypothetical protein
MMAVDEPIQQAMRNGVVTAAWPGAAGSGHLEGRRHRFGSLPGLLRPATSEALKTMTQDVHHLRLGNLVIWKTDLDDRIERHLGDVVYI